MLENELVDKGGKRERGGAGSIIMYPCVWSWAKTHAVNNMWWWFFFFFAETVVAALKI